MSGRIILLTFALTAGLAASPAGAVDVSAEVALVSDYRYRGLTLSDGKPAVQGEVSISHDSGLYVTAWASTIEEPGSRIASEMDLTAGDEIGFGEHLTLDLSGTYYLYPSDHGSNYAEAAAVLTGEHRRVTGSLGVSWAPRQRGTSNGRGRSHPNAYIFGEFSYGIPRSKLRFAAHAGYERGAFDEVAGGGKFDWSLGGEVAAGKLRLGMAYVGCTADARHRQALVASLTLAR